MAMVTLCIRYRFNPEKLDAVKSYFENEQRVIERSGGRVVGYFLPTDFAGPTDEAIGLIDLPSITAYETYRGVLADDPEHQTNVARLAQSGAEVAMDRSFIRRVEAL
jgi:NIPSNAP